MTVQATISILLLIFFTLKEMPLVILETNRSLEKRRQEYGSNFSSYPKIFQWLVWLTMICSYPPFLYHTLYTVFVIVAFFDRIFISVLLLDIFVRIPLLRKKFLIQVAYWCRYGGQRYKSSWQLLHLSWCSITSSFCYITTSRTIRTECVQIYKSKQIS